MGDTGQCHPCVTYACHISRFSLPFPLHYKPMPLLLGAFPGWVAQNCSSVVLLFLLKLLAFFRPNQSLNSGTPHSGHLSPPGIYCIKLSVGQVPSLCAKALLHGDKFYSSSQNTFPLSLNAFWATVDIFDMIWSVGDKQGTGPLLRMPLPRMERICAGCWMMMTSQDDPHSKGIWKYYW